eukprot:gene21956-28426_t
MKLNFNVFQSFSTANTNEIKSVAITGATGLIGSELVKSLESKNIKVIRLTTKKSSKESDVQWNPAYGYVSDVTKINGVDAIINLAGENVGSGEGILAVTGRWTPSKKDKILTSRINSTKLIVDIISKLSKKPKVLLSASAIGYYGNTESDEIYDESTPRGKGFLSDVCVATESEAEKSKSLGVRLVLLRTSVVLSPKAGVLAKLLLPFSLGTGGIIGSGKQGFSWVTITDAVRAIEFALLDNKVSGPINIASPNPVNNAIFTDALGKALFRPTFIPLPEFVVKIVFGEFGEELLLGGRKIVSSKLEKYGFKFEDDDIYSAIKKVLTLNK